MSRSKYQAIAVEVDGIRFPSKAEAKRYGELKLLERAGQISHLEVHPKFPLVIDGAPVRSLMTKDGKVGRQIIVEMDFAYFENGQRVFEDFKGKDTDVSRLKRALLEHIFRVRVRVTGRAA